MKTFNANGTDGMLDVILGCTLIFILLTALIQVDSGKGQEITLPDIELSKTAARNTGASKISRTVISLKDTAGEPVIFIDNKPASWNQLKTALKAMKGVGNIALRRDRELACKWEDLVIAECRNAGIPRVAIVVSCEQAGQ